MGGQFQGQARTFGSTTIENTTNLVGCIAVYSFNGEETEFLSLNTSNSSSIQDIAFTNNMIYSTGRTAVTSNSGSSTKSYFLSDYEITDEVLSIEDLDGSDLDIKVFPNPANQILHISTNKIKLSTIKIFNNSGQEIITLAPNNFECSIDISQLTQGVYFVKVNHAVFKQIIK